MVSIGKQESSPVVSYSKKKSVTNCLLPPSYGVKLATASCMMLNCIDGTWDQHGRWAVMPRHHMGPDRIKEYTVQLLPSMGEAWWLEHPSIKIG
jgi:hypothetical protein